MSLTRFGKPPAYSRKGSYASTAWSKRASRSGVSGKVGHASRDYYVYRENVPTKQLTTSTTEARKYLRKRKLEHTVEAMKTQINNMQADNALKGLSNNSLTQTRLRKLYTLINEAPPQIMETKDSIQRFLENKRLPELFYLAKTAYNLVNGATQHKRRQMTLPMYMEVN